MGNIPHSPTHSHSRVRESGNEAMCVLKTIKTWRWESPESMATLVYKTMRGYVARSVDSAWLYHDVMSISVPQEICMPECFFVREWEKVAWHGSFFVRE